VKWYCVCVVRNVDVVVEHLDYGKIRVRDSDSDSDSDRMIILMI
jgi:hypothetical protein